MIDNSGFAITLARNIAGYCQAIMSGETHAQARSALSLTEDGTTEPLRAAADAINALVERTTGMTAEAIQKYCTERMNGRNQAEASLIAKPDFLGATAWDEALTEIESLIQIVLIRGTPNPPGLRPATSHREGDGEGRPPC